MKTLTSGDVNLYRGAGELPDLAKIARSDNSQLQHLPANPAAIENSFLRAPPQIRIEAASPIKLSQMSEGSDEMPRLGAKSTNVNKIHTDQNLLRTSHLVKSAFETASKESAKEVNSRAFINIKRNRVSGPSDSSSAAKTEGKSGPRDREDKWSQGEPIGSCDSPRDMKATSSDDDGDQEEELDDVKDLKGEALTS